MRKRFLFPLAVLLALVGLGLRRAPAPIRPYPVDLLSISVEDPCYRAHGYIDRSNATGCADDRNDCGSETCQGRHGPCRTFYEWNRRCPHWADESFACVTILHSPVSGTYFDNVPLNARVGASVSSDMARADTIATPSWRVQVLSPDTSVLLEVICNSAEKAETKFGEFKKLDWIPQGARTSFQVRSAGGSRYVEVYSEART